MTAVAAFLQSLLDGCEVAQLRQVRVLVAVSGGADSVALLRGLVSLRDNLQCDLHVGHLNHQLRGAESDADSDWVQQLCDAINVPCVLGTAHIRDMPELPRLGLEGTARLARKRFLQQVAIEKECAAIAVAHTANDQAETILHHILRGTGLAGLRGMEVGKVNHAVGAMPVAVIPTLRPMLQLDREAVEQFLAEVNQPFRTDSSNRDTQLTRNRIRHELLPLLARDFNPRIQQALLQLGEQAAEVYGAEVSLAQQLMDAALVEFSPNRCRLQCSAFAGQPAHRIREAFVDLWRRLGWPRRQMGFAEWTRLAELVAPHAKSITLPGAIVGARRGDLLMLSKDGELS